MKNAFRTVSILLVAVILAVSALSQPGNIVRGCDTSCDETPTPTPVVEVAECTFDITSVSGTAPFLVSVTNTSLVDGASIWDYGDREVTVGENSNHIYGAGSFKLEHMIKSDEGIECLKSVYITVKPAGEAEPVSSSTAVAPQSIGARNSADNASTNGDNSPIIVGNNNSVDINVYPVVVAPCDTAETKTGLFNAFGESWKTFFQTLLGGKK